MTQIDDRAIALALAAHKLARDVWEQPEPEPKPKSMDMRQRAIEEMLEKYDEPKVTGPGINYELC